MPKITDLPAASAVNAADLLVVVDQSGTATTKKTQASSAATSFMTLAKGVKSDTTGIAGSAQIVNMVSLTQAQYDAIESPASDTLYVIVD